MKELIRPIPAHSNSHRLSAVPAAVSYVNNTVEARDPAGPKWVNKLLALLKLELVKR